MASPTPNPLEVQELNNSRYNRRGWERGEGAFAREESRAHGRETLETCLADVRLGDGDLAEFLHSGHAIQEAVVKINVDHHRAVFHLKVVTFVVSTTTKKNGHGSPRDDKNDAKKNRKEI